MVFQGRMYAGGLLQKSKAAVTAEVVRCPNRVKVMAVKAQEPLQLPFSYFAPKRHSGFPGKRYALFKRRFSSPADSFGGGIR
jgi:hypothetical protein